MQRCLQLALFGEGQVAPNPMVGAVLVNENRIIGEGYHESYGEAHAEVNCINSVLPEDQPKIPASALYVSLEPCSHYGKTPPCTELILRHKIAKVFIGCRDPFPRVNGRGIEQLKAAGVEVNSGILERACIHLNKRFFRFHQQHRPYIVLKWAQTVNGRIGSGGLDRWKISGPLADRFVHQRRSAEMAILVGTQTALLDDPQLNIRYWPGKDPLRMVVDLDLRLPSSLRLFAGSQNTIVFNALRHEESGPVYYYQVTREVSLIQQIVHGLYHMGVQSILVEGGARLLQSFIDESIWDEAIQITNTALMMDGGIPSPILTGARKVSENYLGGDRIETFIPSTP